MLDKVMQNYLVWRMLSATVFYSSTQPAKLFWYWVHMSKNNTAVKFFRWKLSRWQEIVLHRYRIHLPLDDWPITISTCSNYSFTVVKHKTIWLTVHNFLDETLQFLTSFRALVRRVKSSLSVVACHLPKSQCHWHKGSRVSAVTVPLQLPSSEKLRGKHSLSFLPPSPGDMGQESF